MNTAAQCILIPQIRYTFLSAFNLRAFTAELILLPTLAELIKKFIMLGFYVPSVRPAFAFRLARKLPAAHPALLSLHLAELRNTSYDVPGRDYRL